MAENREIPWENEFIEKYMFILHKEQVEVVHESSTVNVD